jgi:hypothetical protein
MILPLSFKHRFHLLRKFKKYVSKQFEVYCTVHQLWSGPGSDHAHISKYEQNFKQKGKSISSSISRSFNSYN